MIANPKYFVGRNFYNIFQYFGPKNFPLLFQLKALVNHYPRVRHFFDDPHLRAAFTFQDMYLGLSPFEALATYSLLQYTELARGVWFPMGGLYRVVESFVEIAEANGVQFRYNTPVREIEIVDNRAQGVILDDGERLRADLVVANADLPYVYRALLPDPGPVKRLERMKYTCSAIMFYWGLDKIYPQLDHHNVFLAGDYKASFDRIFKDKTLLDSLNFYVHAPARTDPAAAPEGEETLMVLIPVGHLDASVPQDWEALKARARASVLQCLEPMGVTDLDDHMKFEVCYAPKQWKVLYNLERGAAFGLSHNFTQVGYLRPQNRHRRYHNLFFVGSSTHPGTGLPIVLLSARLTTERIMKEQPLSS